MKKSILIVMSFVTVIISCKKDEIAVKENPDSPVSQQEDGNDNYTPLAVGNYWIYKNYEIDSLGNETEVSYLDSIIITHDTIINGNIYYIFEGAPYPITQIWRYIKVVRDSGGYLVNDKGDILFSSNDFSNILNQKIEVNNSGDTIYTLQFKMEQVSQMVSIPAGVFSNVYNFKGTLKVPGSPLNPRYLDNYYAPAVGEIIKTNSFVTQPKMFKKKLLRYFIN